MKRREKDNAKRAQSRRWYFEKADWIVSDEIEDENTDEAIEACYKQSIDPSELLNKQSEEFYDVDPKNGTTVE